MKVTIYTASYGNCVTKEKYGIEHALGLKLLARGLEELYHLSYTPDQLSEALSKNEYGKPYLSAHPDIFFNISHTDNFVVCGFAERKIGIDAEIIGTYPAVVFRKVFTADEVALIENAPDENRQQEMFARLWTLKESRIKEAGMGFSMSPVDFSFDIDCSMESVKIRCSEAGIYFAQQVYSIQAPGSLTKVNENINRINSNTSVCINTITDTSLNENLITDVKFKSENQKIIRYMISVCAQCENIELEFK